MPVKRVDRGEHLVALGTFIAFVRSIIEMNFTLVRHHVTIAAEAFGADITVVVLDAGMGDHVPREVTGRDETFVARRANVVAFVGVNFLVRLKVTQGRKLFAADFALIRPFAGVRPDVY